MGVDYCGQERGVEELRRLSPAAKEYLAHHLRTALATVIGGIHIERPDMAVEAAWHAVRDLERIGC